MSDFFRNRNISKLGFVSNQNAFRNVFSAISSKRVRVHHRSEHTDFIVSVYRYEKSSELIFVSKKLAHSEMEGEFRNRSSISKNFTCDKRTLAARLYRSRQRAPIVRQNAVFQADGSRLQAAGGA